MKNYYEILEVNPKASYEIIEKAYKVLVKKYHPDLYSGTKKEYAQEKIKEINEAYHILSNQFLREQYDNEIYNQSIRYTQGEVQTKVNHKRKEKLEETKEEIKTYKVGTFGSLIDLTKGLFQDLARNQEKRKGQKRKMNQTDFLAMILTVGVVIFIGVLLWFIPFTNGWMRQLLFENPIFSWIGGLF